MTSSLPQPVNGRGGFLWHENVTFPIYSGSGVQFLTWEELDDLWNVNSQLLATSGISLGLCLMAVMVILALTPSTKRGLPLFTFNLITLILLILRYLLLVVCLTELGAGSAYYNLVYDNSANLTPGTKAAQILSEWCAPLALLSIQPCFYIQARAVLCNVRLKYPRIYYGLLTYLVGLAGATVLLRFVYAGYQTAGVVGWGGYWPWFDTSILILYSASIGSWSLVFTFQVAMVLNNRFRKLGIPFQRSEAISILLMTGVESMIFPILFCVLELAKIHWFLNAEYLVLPSVAIVMPFGSIWAGAAQQNSLLQKSGLMTGIKDQNTCSNCGHLLAEYTSPSNPSNNSNSTARSPFPRNPYREFDDRITPLPPLNNSTLNGNRYPSATLNNNSAPTIASPTSPTFPRQKSNDLGLMDALHDDLGQDDRNAVHTRRGFMAKMPKGGRFREI